MNKSHAFHFVLLLGMVNLFADATYEGASSINGPFLGTLGATAAAIGIIAGLGEFLGYVLRSLFGYAADKTGKYWFFTFVGYAINLLSVPALALTGHWQTAAVLVIAERVGRAIRKPSVEAMLSYTTHELGSGWVYGVNTALDQTGATVGPLVLSFILFMKGDYRTGYAWLLVPALCALAILLIAQRLFPHPSKLEGGPTAKLKGFSRPYWLYMGAGSCVAAGLLSFEFISFHFAKHDLLAPSTIPLLFSLAMATDAISSLFLGRAFDRLGLPVVLTAFFLSSLFAPFVFLGSGPWLIVGIILWGIGFGAQDTLLKAIIAGLLPEGKRSLAFGLFYIGYGTGWLIGSTVTGLLYAHSLYWVAAFSLGVQLISLPLFAWAKKAE